MFISSSWSSAPSALCFSSDSSPPAYLVSVQQRRSNTSHHSDHTLPSRLMYLRVTLLGSVTFVIFSILLPLPQNPLSELPYSFVACNPVIDISKCMLRISVACHIATNTEVFVPLYLLLRLGFGLLLADRDETVE